MSEQTILSVRVSRARDHYPCTAGHKYGLIQKGDLYFRMFYIDHDQDKAIHETVCHACMKSCTHPKVLEALKEYDKRKAIEEAKRGNKK